MGIYARNCGNCGHSDDAGDDNVVCLRFPPSAFPVPQQSRVIGGKGGVQIGQIAVSPVVPKERRACGEWKNSEVDG
jgi:hypothetical protein